MKKSAAQRNAKISEEKIKHVVDKLTNEIKQFRIDTDQKISEKIKESKQTLSKIDSKIDIIAKEMKHSEDGLKTITEGVTQNTVKICEESKQSTDKINLLTVKLEQSNSKVDSLIESHLCQFRVKTPKFRQLAVMKKVQKKQKFLLKKISVRVLTTK